MIIFLAKRSSIKSFAAIIVMGILSVHILAEVIGWQTAQTSSVAPPDEGRPYWASSKKIIWDIQMEEKLVALTFDDGPSPQFTPQILKILEKNRVPGTFFIIGKEAEKYPAIIRMMAENNNEIANHTYSHPNIKRLSMKALEEEVLKAEETIYRITNDKTTLFRPPAGYYNKKVVALADRLGYKVVMWSWEQQTNDWSNPGTKAIIQSVLKNPAPGRIILLHDRGGDRTQTVQSLQPIIDGLKELGYRFVTVSELIKLSDDPEAYSDR